MLHAFDIEWRKALPLREYLRVKALRLVAEHEHRWPLRQLAAVSHNLLAPVPGQQRPYGCIEKLFHALLRHHKCGVPINEEHNLNDTFVFDLALFA